MSYELCAFRVGVEGMDCFIKREGLNGELIEKQNI